MKRLLTIVLILAILLPAAALAEDPIVGVWYMHIDLNKYPEMKTTFGQYDSLTDLYFFNADGTITVIEGIITDGACTPVFSSAGKWEKSLFDYNVNIIGIGDTTMSISGNEAKLMVQNGNIKIYMKFRRLIDFDPYNDYSF